MARRKYMTRRGKHIPLRGGHVTRKSKERNKLLDDNLATRKNDSLVGTKSELPKKGSLFGSEKLGSFDDPLQ